jgi:spermidine/putrescine transport system ATP-binding protein
MFDSPIKSATNAFVEAVVRPEDIKIVKKGSKASLPGKITSVTFKGVHFEILVDVGGFIWMIQTIEHHKVGEEIGMYIEPDAIHIMNRSEYSGEFGDYSYFSDEMDHISDASYNWEEENEEE